MTKEGKRMSKIRDGIDSERLYPLAEAAALVKERAKAKFDETIEIAIGLGVDPRHADQMVRGSCDLPHGSGRTQRVVVFARGEQAEAARAAGADKVGAEDMVQEIEKKGAITDVDRCVATPDMMALVGRLGKILGPRGLMPNPKSGTVTANPAEAVAKIKKGRVEFRVEKQGIVHTIVGKASFPASHIAENASSLLGALNRAKPSGVKGVYMKKIAMSSTMGPGVRVDPKSALEAEAAS